MAITHDEVDVACAVEPGLPREHVVELRLPEDPLEALGGPSRTEISFKALDVPADSVLSGVGHDDLLGLESTLRHSAFEVNSRLTSVKGRQIEVACAKVRGMKQNLVSLGQVGQLTQGLTYKRHVDPTAEPIRVLHVADLDDLMANRGNPEREERLDLRKNQDARVKAGQVLIALRTSDVKATVVPEGMDEAVASNSLTVFTVNLEIANPQFIAGLLRSKAMQHRLAPLFSGVTIQGIPLSKFRQVELDLPPLERQAAFADAFAAQEAYRRAITTVLSLQTEEIEAQLSPLIAEAN